MEDDERFALLDELRDVAESLRLSRSVEDIHRLEAILGNLRLLYSGCDAEEKLSAIRSYAGWLRSPGTCAKFGGPEKTLDSIRGAIRSLRIICQWDEGRP